ncbi:MAG: HigA family addiction module antitoxin [Candidatus Aminicenantes bacterium]|jgi:hypothetical protein
MISTRKPTHPGEVLLEDVIKPLGLTITAAAKNLGVNRKTLPALVNGKSALTPEILPVFYLSSITCHLRTLRNCQNVKHRRQPLKPYSPHSPHSPKSPMTVQKSSLQMIALLSSSPMTND